MSSRSMSRDTLFPNDLDLSIVGLGVEYPNFRVGPEALETIAAKYYPNTRALRKTLSINKYTGIETRATVGTAEHALINGARPPSIKQLNDFFMKEGVALAVTACQKAIAEWGGDVHQITHVVSTTCTNSANPGFDHYVCKKLGIKSDVEKVLLHGVGCSGGLAAIRTAAGLALGFSSRKRPARILTLACEITSLMVRSELDSIDQDQEVRIGVCLFSDCASACVVSNGIGGEESNVLYELLGWKHDVLEDSEADLRFDVDPLGWKVVLSQRVPTLASARVPLAFESLVESIPSLGKGERSRAVDFDWALHPGGATIITAIERVMELTREHLRASAEIYMQYGNSSSATIMSVLDNLRESPKRDHVATCAFGPGVVLELMILKVGKSLLDKCLG